MISQPTKELISLIKDSQSIMIEQLHEFCNINSGTTNLNGLNLMSQTLTAAFTPLADSIENKALPPVSTLDMTGDMVEQHLGHALFIQKRPSLSRRILLSGHMDTVYGIHDPFQTLNYLDKNTLNGPGVADMKGGLLVILHALSAFEKMDIAPTIGWDVVINSDEEIGSPASSHLFNQIAPRYQAALVYEPAMNDRGTLAKNRKGSGKLTLVATGKSAHAGRAFYEGRNAIAYLAEAIIAIHALNLHQEGVTINVGKIAGGEALNMVPSKAVVKLDVRISSSADERWVYEKIDAIIHQLQRSDYTLTLHGAFGRPVKTVDKATTRLFQRIQNLGASLGLTLDWQDSGGCCDGNNLAQHGIPVLDTLGVRGGHIHSPKEYILLDSLPERAALSLLILQDLASGGLEELMQ